MPQPLRVLVDAGYGRLLVTPLVPRFLEHFGGIELQVALTDSPPTAPERRLGCSDLHATRLRSRGCCTHHSAVRRCCYARRPATWNGMAGRDPRRT